MVWAYGAKCAKVMWKGTAVDSERPKVRTRDKEEWVEAGLGGSSAYL